MRICDTLSYSTERILSISDSCTGIHHCMNSTSVEIAHINPPLIRVFSSQNILSCHRCSQLLGKVRSRTLSRVAARPVVLILSKGHIVDALHWRRVPDAPPCWIDDLAEVGILEYHPGEHTPRPAEIVDASFSLDSSIDAIDCAVADDVPARVVGVVASRCGDAAGCYSLDVDVLEPGLCCLAEYKVDGAHDLRLCVDL